MGKVHEVKTELSVTVAAIAFVVFRIVAVTILKSFPLVFRPLYFDKSFVGQHEENSSSK